MPAKSYRVVAREDIFEFRFRVEKNILPIHILVEWIARGSMHEQGVTTRSRRDKFREPLPSLGNFAIWHEAWLESLTGVGNGLACNDIEAARIAENRIIVITTKNNRASGAHKVAYRFGLRTVPDDIT